MSDTLDASFFNAGQDQSGKRDPVIPIFKMDAVKMEYASREAGRPIMEDREFVTLVIPGARGTTVYEEVNDEHKRRWPREYQAFKENREVPLSGTPLSEIPGMSQALVLELQAMHVRTAEQMRDLSDTALQNLGTGARIIREKVTRWLEAATDAAPLEKALADADRQTIEITRLNGVIRDQAEQIKSLSDQVQALRVQPGLVGQPTFEAPPQMQTPAMSAIEIAAAEEGRRQSRQKAPKEPVT